MLSRVLSLSFVFFIGCASIPIKKEQKNVCDPNFFRHYTPKSNEIVGIGIAGPNLNGFNAQKKSAISKALNEIAMQMGVTINSAYISNKKVVNRSQSYSSAQSYSVQTVNGQKVNAKIVKECKANDGYYYVLMKAY